MGFEYRLHIEPPLSDLSSVCKRVFEVTEWSEIPTSLLDVSGIGVQYGKQPETPSWPQVADLHDEGVGSIYVLCHNNCGGLFMNALIDDLRRSGHRVEIDEDV